MIRIADAHASSDQGKGGVEQTTMGLENSNDGRAEEAAEVAGAGDQRELSRLANCHVLHRNFQPAFRFNVPIYKEEWEAVRPPFPLPFREQLLV